MTLSEPPRGSGLAEVLRLSWPASRSMLNTTAIKFIGGLMVSFVSPAAFSAQFMGGMFAFVPESFGMGVLTVVNTFVAQNYGAGRYRQTGLYALGGILAAIAFGLAVAPLALAAGPIFSIFHHPPEVFAAETMYFRYMILSVMMTLPTRVLEQFFFGIHRPRIVLWGSIVSSVIDGGAGLVLIFGLLGFPAMGLEGAAIGSLLAWGAQFVLLLAVFVSGPISRQYATRLVRAVRWRHVRELIRVGWPAGIQLCNDVSSWSLFSAWLVGRFGTADMAATTIAMRYMGLSFMPAVGIGVAATALVGKDIGEGRPDRARRHTRIALLTAMAYMGLCGLVFLLARHAMVGAFVHLPRLVDVSPQEWAVLADQITRIGGVIMIWVAVFQLFDAVGIVYIGALRGAGDTFWPMAMTIALSWGLTVGGGWLMVTFLPQLTSVGPWITASLYVVALGIVMAARFESGAWRRIDLLGPRRPAGPIVLEFTKETAPGPGATSAPPPPDLDEQT